MPVAAWLESSGHVAFANAAALALASVPNLAAFRQLIQNTGSRLQDGRLPWSFSEEGQLRFTAVHCAAWPLDADHIVYQAYPSEAPEMELDWFIDCGIGATSLDAERELRRSLFSSSADCVKVLDEEARLLYMNPGGRVLMRIEDFGLVRGQDWIGFWSGEHQQSAAAAIATARQGGVGKFVGECAKGDGELGWWDVVVTPMRDRAGQVKGFLSISREVTDLVRNRRLEKLERNILEATAANRPLGEVLSAICTLAEHLVQTGKAAVLVPDEESAHHVRPFTAPNLPQLTPEERLAAADLLSGQVAEPFLAKIGARQIYAEQLQDPDGRTLGFLLLALDEVPPAAQPSDLPSELEPALNLATIALTREAHQRRLRLKQDRLAAIDQTAPIAIYHTTANGQCIFVNQRYAAFTGLTMAEASGEGWLAAVDIRDQATVREAWRRARSEGKHFRAEFRLAARGENSRPRWVMAYESLAANTGYIGALVDISETKQALLEVAESNEKFATLANNITQLCWMADAGGNVFWFNDRWYEFTGFSEQDMKGPFRSMVHHPDHRDRVLEKFYRSLEEGEYWEDTFPLRGKDGEFRWFLSRAVPIRDGAGRILRWFGTNTDVSELRELEAALARQNEALRRSNEELSRFAFVVSHDLQEPVRMMSNYAQLIRRSAGPALDEKSQRHLDTIADSAGRMGRLIRDLLAYARISVDDENPQEAVDLNVSLAGAMENLKGTLEESSTQVHVAGQLPTVHAVSVHMTQLFQNLLSNAIKFRREGVAPRIQVQSVRQDNHWKISVADNGQGFPESQAEKMFGFLQRLHGKEISGSGIGLSTCKTIVERSGGNIGASGEPGVGATFWFTLPVMEKSGPIRP